MPSRAVLPSPHGDTGWTDLLTNRSPANLPTPRCRFQQPPQPQAATKISIHFSFRPPDPQTRISAHLMFWAPRHFTVFTLHSFKALAILRGDGPRSTVAQTAPQLLRKQPRFQPPRSSHKGMRCFGVYGTTPWPAFTSPSLTTFARHHTEPCPSTSSYTRRCFKAPTILWGDDLCSTTSL